MAARADSVLRRVRTMIAEMPYTSERASHGAPAFFVGSTKSNTRCFCHFADDHHGDSRLALWLAAPPGAAASLVEANPDAYFIPPYVGPQGWVGVRLDRRLPWGEIAAVIEQAWRTRAPAKIVRAIV